MPTWGEHYAAEERTARRAATDTVLRARHAQFDLQAQDKTPKSARPKFAVVGEGSRSANENYARGWERTFGRKNHFKETQAAYLSLLRQIEPQLRLSSRRQRSSSRLALSSSQGSAS